MQQHNAEECKDRIWVYPSIALHFHKRQRSSDAMQWIV